MSPSHRPVPEGTREEALNRLRRIEGQVRGIQRMVDEGRDCRDIVRQLAAVRAAVTSLSGVLVECYTRDCFESASDRETMVTDLTDLIDLLQKTSR